MKLGPTLVKWLVPAAALFALACALLAPVEAGNVPLRGQNMNVQQEAAQPEPSDSIVRGRVVYDDTNRPVRRARVMLITDGGRRGEYAGLTDGRGEFEIKGVRAGAYYAFVDVPGVLSPVGFVSIDELRSASGAPDLGEGRKYFDLVEVDGKQNVSVTVHARRGASVAGRVSYADGDPAVNVNITLMRRSPDGRVQKYLTGASLVSLSGLRTDDRGMFRLSGLPPGEYLVSVNETVNHGTQETGTNIADDFPGMLRGLFTQPLLMTFYPSATSLKEAGSIRLGIGEERADVDITIPERDLRTVNGVVRTRRGGVPLRNAWVTVKRRDDPLAPPLPAAVYYSSSASSSTMTMTDAEGRWQFSEIPDGSYVIDVKPPEEYEDGPAIAANMNSSVANANIVVSTNMNTTGYSSPRRKRAYAPMSRDLEVSGGDVSELVVEVADGARLTGTVTIEGSGAPRYGYLTVVRLGEGGGVVSGTGPGGVSLDGGRFSVEGLPAGRFVLQPNVGGAAGGEVYLKSINWNGKDLLREPLVLAEGVSVEGIRIVYARNPATLNVIIGAAGRRSPEEIFVALVPADLSAWSPNARRTFCTTNDASGCSLTAPPGEYRVVALRRTSAGGYEPEVMRRAPTAPRVTLREGEAARVEIAAPDN